MSDGSMDGIRGEYRRFTAAEVGMTIRMFREGRGIKRAVLAVDANMSEKTLERAEAGQGISEESCRRVARALGLPEDMFVASHYVPAPEEAGRLLKQAADARDAKYHSVAVAELKGVRDVLALFRADALLGGDQNVADDHIKDFGELKEAWWEWNAVSEDIGEAGLVDGARSYLAEVRGFEARGYVVKSGLAQGRRNDGSRYCLGVLVAFRKPQGMAAAPDEVLLPKKIQGGF